MEGDQILLDPLLQGFILFQRFLGAPVALHVVPDKFIGVQVRRVGRQEVQFQTPAHFGDVGLDQVGLVRGMTVHHRHHLVLRTLHEVAQEQPETFRIELARIGRGPKGSAGGDRADGVDALALPGASYHRGAAFESLALHSHPEQ